jgi:hypothetical protein
MAGCALRPLRPTSGFCRSRARTAGPRPFVRGPEGSPEHSAAPDGGSVAHTWRIGDSAPRRALPEERAVGVRDVDESASRRRRWW